MIEPTNFGGFAFRDLQGQDRWFTRTESDVPFVTLFPTMAAIGITHYYLRWRIVGKACEGQCKFWADTSIATTAGTDYFVLPVGAQGVAGFGVMTDETALTAVGTCHLDVSNSRLYMPTQAASGNKFNLYFSYEIA